jgi:ABC-2 type transport system permease protein
MRMRTLVEKEFLDLARNRAALVPVLIVTVMALVLPFAVAIGIPVLTGRGLGADADLVKVSSAAAAPASLSNDGRVQLFLFQQFLMLFLLTPITGAMALAAHAIVGEKQARTLEPLLATPITTFELLAAKVVGALAPTLAISLAGLVLYFAGIALFAVSGVAAAMASARTVVLIVLVAPAVALVSLQAAILISSRVNDARTAQQFGVLIILPLTGVLVAQFSGSFWLSASTLALVGAAMLGVWVLLTLASVALFEREAILTRWR